MTNRFKSVVGALPVIGPQLRIAYRLLFGRKKPVFRASSQYWEDRYRLGGTSGSGSYGRLAQFKAQIINSFIAENEIQTVVEYGCGDGAQLALASYPTYVGFDVSIRSIELCRYKFSANPAYEFHLTNSPAYVNFDKAELGLSLDVVYHLIEDDVFHRYMERLFSSASRYVIIYSYDFDALYSSKHERGRKFTTWIAEHARDWRLVQVVPNEYPYDRRDPDGTSQSDFFIYQRL